MICTLKALTIFTVIVSLVKSNESSFELRREALQDLPVKHPSKEKLRMWQIRDEDRFNEAEDGDYEYQIVYGTELRPREQQALSAFRHWTEENELPVPPGWATEENNDLRVLMMSQGDFEVTYETMIHADTAYRLVASNFFEVDSPDHPMLKSLNNGWAYALGRDREMYPIVVLNFRKLLDSEIVEMEYAKDDFDSLCYYVQEFGTEPGIVEKWHGILDFKDVGFFDLSVSFISQWAKSTKTGFHQRMKSLTVINLPLWLEITGGIKHYLFKLNKCSPFEEQQVDESNRFSLASGGHHAKKASATDTNSTKPIQLPALE